MTSDAAATERIPRIPDKPVPFILYVLRHCSPSMKLYAVAAVLFETISTVSDILVRWVFGRIIGVMIEFKGDIWIPLGKELLLLATLWTIRNVSFRLREYTERIYVPELMNTTRSLLFNRLLHQSQAFLHGNFAGVLANHVRRGGDVIASLRDRLQHNVLPLFLRIVTGGFLLWQITPLLDLFIFSFIAVGIFFASKTSPAWTRLSTANAESASRLTGYVVDSTTNLSLVQQNAGWIEERRKMDDVQEKLTATWRERSRYSSIFWGCFDTAMTFFFCGFMALLVFAWQGGHVSTANIAMAVTLIMTMFGSIAETVYLMSAKFDDIGLLQEALQKISVPFSVLDKKDAKNIAVDKGNIEFRDVVFAYGAGNNVFDGFNLFIPGGQKVGIVGISGAGKTTLCQLLLRSYDVTGGGVYVDGQNVAEVTQDSLRSSIAVIPQDPVLFHRTLKENIRYGRPTATDEEIRGAARAAEAAGFIEVLPNTYDTLVGERGVKLSGGQRQRVAIARALVKKSPVLVLDEATSSLDSETEKSIQAAMARAMEGRTTIVIAHRLSTLKMMDRIVLLEQGRIIEDGSFQDLIERQGAFHHLWQLQAGGFLPTALAG